MRTFIKIVVLLLLATNANAQWFTVNNLSGTTAPYGTNNVTVLGAGTFSTYPGWCGAIPYWIGNFTGGVATPGWYHFTFSTPTKSIKVYSTASDPGESIAIKINGVHYSLTAANLIPWPSTCGTPVMTLVGDSLVSVGGNSSAEIVITYCSITSVEVETDGLSNGTVFTFMFSDSGACFNVTANNPCVGDTIKLDAVGDSTGATYSWSGPAGFTSTAQAPFIFPATMADSGIYRVIRIIGITHDTGYVHVTVHPLPMVNLTNNAPLCVGLLDTLKLSVTPDSTGETFSWSGPVGFTSTLEFPIVPAYTAINVGVYSVTATTRFGCKASGAIYAGIVPPPPPPTITGKTSYCYGDPPEVFIVSGTGTILWYPTLTSTVGSTSAPTVNTSLAGTFTYYADQTIGSCESGKGSITVIVYPKITPSFTVNYVRGCNGDNVDFVNSSTGATQYLWHFGDASPISIVKNPSHFYQRQGLDSVNLICYGVNPVCTESLTKAIDTRHTVVADFNALVDTVCVGQSITMNNTSTATVNIPEGVTSPGVITTYSWQFGDGSTDATIAPTYTYPKAGYYTATLTVTDSIGCKSTISKPIYVLQVDINTFHDTMLCVSQPLLMSNMVSLTPKIVLPFTYTWSPSTGLSDTTLQNPYFNAVGLFVYNFTATVNNYGCTATEVIKINSVLGAPVTNITASATIPYGNSVQLNADNQVFYRWLPNDGSLSDPNINNPIATPNRTTLYTVYGYDKNGCLDSAYVTIYVDSTMVENSPTGFTPNGDGLNDIYHLVGLKYRNLVDFRIYNRWGQQVFYTANFKDGWDGTFNGVAQDVGTYFYTVIVSRPGGDGENVVYKGELTLIR